MKRTLTKIRLNRRLSVIPTKPTKHPQMKIKPIMPPMISNSPTLSTEFEFSQVCSKPIVAAATTTNVSINARSICDSQTLTGRFTFTTSGIGVIESGKNELFNNASHEFSTSVTRLPMLEKIFSLAAKQKPYREDYRWGT